MISREAMEDFRPVLASFVNLERLAILCIEHYSPRQLCALFQPMPRFPFLRHLDLRFILDQFVLNFIRHHCDLGRLESIGLEHQDYIRMFVPDIASTMQDLMQGPLVAPPSCSALYSTPVLAPHLLPGSHFTRVSMYWDISQDIEELEPLIPGLVRAMEESRSPVVHITYSTPSHNWNLAFVSLAATQLTALEYLFIQNNVYGGEDWRSDGDAFIVSVTTMSCPRSFSTTRMTLT